MFSPFFEYKVEARFRSNCYPLTFVYLTYTVFTKSFSVELYILGSQDDGLYFPIKRVALASSML